MASYSAKVKTRAGGVKALEVTGKTKDDARAYAERVGRVITLKRRVGLDLSAALSPADRQIMFARLSAMLSSRVGTSDALRLLRDTFTGKISEVSGRLLSYVESGDDLSSAIARVGSPHFPEATIALIQAGSRSGETWKAIKDAAEFEYQLHNVRKGASKGLAMGVGSFLFAGITTVVSTNYVGPKIMSSDMIKMGGGSVDIGWVTTAGNVIGYMMATLLAVLLIAWIVAYFGRRLMPVQADKLILKIPFYKDLVLSRNAFVVLYGLALLVKSGVRTEEALRLAAEGAPKGALKRDLFSAMQAVKTGKPWAKAMETLHPTDRAALECAVDREQIAHTLDTLSTQYRELYAQRLASFVPVLNMLAALFLSLAGAVLFGESILPMLMASNGMM